MEDRGGYDLTELDYRPVNKYLPPREPQINVLDDGQPLSLVSMADNTNQMEPSNNSILGRYYSVSIRTNYASCLFSYNLHKLVGCRLWKFSHFGTVKVFLIFALNPLYGFFHLDTLLIVTVGLISSTTHLGHPRRADAITVALLLAFKGRRFCSSLLFASRCLLRIFSYSHTFNSIIDIICLLTIAFSLATVFAQQKFTSLKTIRQWNHLLVVPVYLIIGLFDGAIFLMVLLTIIDGLQFFQLNYFIIFLGAAAGLAKILYWWSIDSTQSQSNTSTATGLVLLISLFRCWMLHHFRNIHNAGNGFCDCEKAQSPSAPL